MEGEIKVADGQFRKMMYLEKKGRSIYEYKERLFSLFPLCKRQGPV